MYSLCITTYNRHDLTIDSFLDVLYDDRISEIVIVDDFSDPKIYTTLSVMIEGVREGGGYKTGYHKKLKLYRNDENLGMSRNKAKAIELATNDWCIIFDSDNRLPTSYIDAIPNYLKPQTIYAPAYARPQFDYRQLAGITYDSDKIAKSIHKPGVEMMLNTCNYLVNREEYLQVYEYNPAMKGTDTIWFNYLWLRSGRKIHVTDGME